MAIQAQFYSDNLGFPLSNPQDFTMENACGFNQFCSKPEMQMQQQQQQQLYMQYQQLQNLHQRNQSSYVDNNVFQQKSHQSMNFSQNLAAHIEKQRLETDRFISLQNERIKWAIQEQTKQQLAIILKKYEAKTQFLLKQKDEAIAKAAKRRMELEEFLKKVEMENETWQRLAKENESMVVSLNNTIEQLKESGCLSTNEVEDAESCCDVIENREQENAEQITRKMVCKSCKFRSSCIIMLPCRHLCLCKDCETFLHSCPVCGIEKKATLVALI